MSSDRFVRFASSDNVHASATLGEDALNSSFSHHQQSDTFSAIEATLTSARGVGGENNNNNRRASNDSSNHSGENREEELGRDRMASAMMAAGGPHSVAASMTSLDARRNNVNAAIAANDGPSLAAALAQSIRHHARSIDGEQQPRNRKEEELRAKDPYEDDDHVSLAPGVELNYDKEGETPGPGGSSSSQAGGTVGGNNIVPALRAYLANAGAEETSTAAGGGDDRRGGDEATIDRTFELQQERIDERLRDVSFGTRFKKNISNWFGLEAPDDDDDDDEGGDAAGNASSARSVRFAGDPAGEAVAGGESIPGVSAYGAIGHGPKFVAPPPSSFRTATRHPSHLDAAQFDDIESRLAAPRRMLAARKRHRRNDSFLRLVALILCFAVSLAFAVVYGQGQLGLALTTVAYERKIAGRYDPSSVHGADDVVPRDVFYPDWWEDELGIPDMEARGVKFSPTLEYNAADVATPRAPDRIETPFFWFVPRSGGNVIRTLMAKCLRLAEASEHGAGTEATFLRIEEQEDRKFVNVDMSTTEGIEHAKDLDLASSGVSDVIISGDIHGVLAIFNNRNRARVFAVLRHPLVRAISKYYSDLAFDPDVAGMTLPQYVRSGGHRVENNYLTRYLSGRYGGKLTVHHLDVAREFLRRKFVVGLASDLPATANLFGHVFGWNHTAAGMGLSNVDLCYNDIFDALSNKSPPSIEEGTEGWKLLVAQNWFDLKLYEYAEHLFRVQVDQLKVGGPSMVDASRA